MAILVSKRMSSTLPKALQTGLERSCNPSTGDWIRRAPPQPVFERFEAYFSGHAYDPHRHDSYAIGTTMSGVQLFRYRGAEADSRTGDAIVIHPDELHDGHAGIETGFCYRMLYVAPRYIQEALGDSRPLPFVPRAVLDDPRLVAALQLALGDLDRPLEPLETEQALLAIADTLQLLSGSRAPQLRTLHSPAVEGARDYLDAHFQKVVGSGELETASGLDRFTLARQFRARLGTSPYRYLTMRRLDRARDLIRAGEPLAEVAAAAGFADQSHMTRQFKQAFGLTPGRWLSMQRQARP
jgi:AraC-like DNA-binding protein